MFGQILLVNYRNAFKIAYISCRHTNDVECVPIEKMKESDTHLLVACAKRKNIMHLHETFQTMSLSFEILYVCTVHTYRMVGLKRLFNDHFILKMQKIEMKLFYFCFGCWANTTNYLLDRHGNYALSRCRMFWFVHKLCIVNVNKSMCSNTLGRKDT